MMIMEKEDIATKLRIAVERAAGKMGVDVEEKGIDRLILYAEELKKWNKAYNLVGRKLGVEGLVDLYIDALSTLCIRGLLEGEKEVIDIGSGAGMPGIPLYLLAGPFPLTMVESQRKKITFIRHICRKLEMEQARVYPGRLEHICREEEHLNAYELGFARAVMDPMRLVKLARPLLCEGGKLVLYVGKTDAERMRKGSLRLQEKGMRLEAMRSTQRIVGKERFLAVMVKKDAVQTAD